MEIPERATELLPVVDSEIYRIPFSLQSKCPLNKLIAPLVTKDLFKKQGPTTYKYWKKRPVKAISYLDRMCKTFNWVNLESTGVTQSAMIRIILRLKGQNKMEQVLEKQQQRKEAIEKHNAMARDQHDKQLKSATKVRKLSMLAPNFIEDIKERSAAMAQEEEFKKVLLERAKKLGWLGVTIEEIDMDLSSNYRKISKQLDKVDNFEDKDIKLLNVLQTIRKDKFEIQKFHTNTKIKLAELNEKKKLRQEVGGLILEGMDDTLEIQ